MKLRTIEEMEQALPFLEEFLSNPAVEKELHQEGKKVAWKQIERIKSDLSFRKRERELAERVAKATKEHQDKCPHISGCNSLGSSYSLSSRTSIVWHTLRSGETIGLCTNCQRKFQPTDSDYDTWRRKPSTNRLSASGDGFLTGVEEDPEDINQFTEFDLPFEPRTEEDFLRLPFEELDKRSDFEIKKVMEYVREQRKAQKLLEAQND